MDLPELVHLNPPDWNDITPAFRQYLEKAHCTPMKLVIDHHMVGVGTAICHGRTGWLGHIIVHPEFRSHGLGTYITRHLVDLLLQQRVKTIMLIATTLGEPVYRKIGFKNETTYDFFKREAPFPGSGEVRSTIAFSEDYIDQLRSLDRLISGEERSAWLEPYLSEARLHVVDGILKGYYVPDLGDGLINAIESESGLALMNVRLQDHHDAVVPFDNVQAISLLESIGFVRHLTAGRMWLGEKHSWKPGCVYNRISGALG